MVEFCVVCASRHLTTNKRKTIVLRMGWCHKRGENPAWDGCAGRGGNELEKQGRPGPRAKITFYCTPARFSPDARCKHTKENIVDITETSPQATVTAESGQRIVSDQSQSRYVIPPSLFFVSLARRIASMSQTVRGDIERGNNAGVC